MGGMCVWEKYFRHEKASAKRSAIKSSSEASRVGVEWWAVWVDVYDKLILVIPNYKFISFKPRWLRGNEIDPFAKCPWARQFRMESFTLGLCRKYFEQTKLSRSVSRWWSAAGTLPIEIENFKKNSLRMYQLRRWLCPRTTRKSTSSMMWGGEQYIIRNSRHQTSFPFWKGSDKDEREKAANMAARASSEQGKTFILNPLLGLINQ